MQTAVKLTTKLSKPLPNPIPTMASTESPWLLGGGNGYPNNSLLPTKELALKWGVFPLLLARVAGIMPDNSFLDTSNALSLTRRPSCGGMGPLS
eukprot:Gb_00096 [translate_table: standard]